MRAAVLHQVHRASLATPQREELAEHLHTHWASGLECVADLDRMPEPPQIASGQGARTDVGEILARVGLAHQVVPTVSQLGTASLIDLHGAQNTTLGRKRKASVRPTADGTLSSEEA